MSGGSLLCVLVYWFRIVRKYGTRGKTCVCVCVFCVFFCRWSGRGCRKKVFLCFVFKKTVTSHSFLTAHRRKTPLQDLCFFMSLKFEQSPSLYVALTKTLFSCHKSSHFLTHVSHLTRVFRILLGDTNPNPNDNYLLSLTNQLLALYNLHHNPQLPECSETKNILKLMKKSVFQENSLSEVYLHWAGAEILSVLKSNGCVLKYMPPKVFGSPLARPSGEQVSVAQPSAQRLSVAQPSASQTLMIVNVSW